MLALFLLAALLPAGRAGAADRYFQTSDGVRLHFLDTGPGNDRTIVMVPGWTMPAWIFSAQIMAFQNHYHVVAFDPRSQGDSQIATSGHTPWRRGQDIAELLDQLGPQPVVLMGWSLGVLDSLSYVAAHGDARLAGVVLVDNSVGEDPAPAPSPSVTPRRARVRLTRDEKMRLFVAGMFEHPQPPEYLDRLTLASLRTPPEAAAALLSYPVPRSFWKEAVYSITRPLFYIVRPRWAAQAANLVARDPAAEALVMKGVGHALFVDDPLHFDQAVDGFIRRRVWP